MKKHELEQQMERIYTPHRKTAELRETYNHYSGIVAQAEESFRQGGYQSHHIFRPEMALDLTNHYRHHLIGETDETSAEFKEQEDDLEDALVDLSRKEAQDEH